MLKAVAMSVPRTASPAKSAAAPRWMALLGTSEQGGRDYRPATEGEIPRTLRGALYRNGPGLFERGGHRLRHLLDGDGLVQRLSFSGDGVRYQNAFVQTEKLKREAQAGKYLHGTWTTRRPGGFPRNMGVGTLRSQAGITVDAQGGVIFARDEIGPSYELDPETLATLRYRWVGDDLADTNLKAHSKRDPVSGERVYAAQAYGGSMRLHLVIQDKAGATVAQFGFACPRQVYIHDFFLTRRHCVFLLHPCRFSRFRYLSGLKSFVESLSWNGSRGSVLAVVSRAGGAARFHDVPASFMWHALNAFEVGEEILCDFVGYDEPDHFIGKNPLFATLMRGRLGAADCPGKIRRLRIDIARNRATEEILDPANHEFPMIDKRRTTRRQRFGFFATGGLGGFNSGLKRLDYESGQAVEFDFGPETHAGEPQFVPRPGRAEGDGWIIAQCLDGRTEKTFFAVFDAATLEQGPIGKVWLHHPLPISFHGDWIAATDRDPMPA